MVLITMDRLREFILIARIKLRLIIRLRANLVLTPPENLPL